MESLGSVCCLEGFNIDAWDDDTRNHIACIFLVCYSGYKIYMFPMSQTAERSGPKRISGLAKGSAL